MIGPGRAEIPRWAVLGIGGGVSWLVVAMSFDPFFAAGSTVPATIWGPDLGRETVAAGLVLLLLAAAWRGGRARGLLVLAWFLFLAFATHRLVEFSDGRVVDRWLTLPVQRLEVGPGPPAEAPRCHVGRWLARCADGLGNELASPSPFPFAPLYPGRWTSDHSAVGMVNSRQ